MGMFIGDQAITMAYLGDLPIGTGKTISNDYVTDGLRNYWDAQYTSSYTAVSGQWIDLISGSIGDLVGNTPEYYITSSVPYYYIASETGKYFELYPSASYYSGSTQPFTWLSWVYFDFFDNNQIMGIGGGTTLPYKDIQVSSRVSGSKTFIAVDNNLENPPSGFASDRYTSSLETTAGTWYQVGFSWPNDGDTTLQGVNLFLNLLTDTPNTGSNPMSINDGLSSRVDLAEYSLTPASDHMNGRFAITMMYNRCLTHDEVKQNFDAFKSRFGY